MPPPGLSPSLAVQRAVPPSFWSQCRCLLAQGFKAELANKERLLTPLLFAATILILFNFVFTDATPALQAKFFVAETFLTLLFALQTSYARTFAPDEQDRVFELLQTYPLSHAAWFLAKYLQTLASSALILIPTLGMTGLFHSSSLGFSLLWSGPLWAAALLSLAGLAALGILLAAMTLKAAGREVLFPLLYFPLAVPVLLASSQAALSFISGVSSGEVGQWLGLLLGFDIIYLTLGILLFGELLVSR